MKFKEFFIKELRAEDLDLEHPFYQDGSDDRNEVELLCKEIDYSEVPPIEIERLKAIIHELESEGANMIRIVAHVDHQGYIFYGVNIKENA